MRCARDQVNEPNRMLTSDVDLVALVTPKHTHGAVHEVSVFYHFPLIFLPVDQVFPTGETRLGLGTPLCTTLTLLLRLQAFYMPFLSAHALTTQHRNMATAPDTNVTDNQNNLVLNLSNFPLTEPMLSLLKRGLTFCPSQFDPNYGQIMAGVEKLFRQMRRTVFFHTEEDSNETNDTHAMLSIINQIDDTDIPPPFEHKKFKNRSDFDVKPERQPTLDTFCKSARRQIYQDLGHTPKFHNLPKPERLAKIELQNNPHIIIKPADKGGCIVIQNTTDYINEAHRQLSDNRFYQPLSEDPTDAHNQLVSEFIDSLVDRGAITQKVADFLVFAKPRTASIYFLPKIHKSTRPPPGRPIVSANHCPTERISGLVDFFLNPYVPKLPSYVKDTTDFVSQIKDFPPVDHSTLLVTLDVTSLYTNIPNEEALTVAYQTLRENRQDSLEALSNRDITHLLKLVLTCNNFEFNQQNYLQIQGVAMGTKVAPTIANLVMGNFEKQFVYSYPTQPSLWIRYIDDNFMIWPHGPAALETFIQHLNSVHPTIKFTFEYSTKSVSFLDTMVIKDDQGKLYTDLYTKPTDTHAYLHYSSCHPQHQKEGGPYGQLLRLKRICSKETDYQKHASNMLTHYSRRGYPPNTLTAAYNKAQTRDREELLSPRTQNPSPATDTPLFCIIPYNPGNPAVRKILQDNWHILETDPKLQCVADKPLTVGHTRLSNLGDDLVHSKLRYPPTDTHTPAPRQPKSDKLCTSNRCRYCPHLNKSGKVTSLSTGRSFIIPTRISCKLNNLIYCITCKKCKMQYVGQSKNTLASRFQKHFKWIEHVGNWANAPTSYKTLGPTNVGLHFNLPGHTLEDVSIQVLELIRAHPDSATATKLRDEREYDWMHKLKCLAPLGINATDGSNQSRTRPNRPRGGLGLH